MSSLLRVTVCPTISFRGAGEKDFRFQNTLNHPILIKTETGAGFVTVRIYSHPEANPQIRLIPPALEVMEPESDAFEPLPGEDPKSPGGNGHSAPRTEEPSKSRRQTGTSPGSREPSEPNSPGDDREGGERPNDEEDDNETGDASPSPSPPPDPNGGDDDSEEEPEEPGGSLTPGHPPEEPPEEDLSQEVENRDGS